jgi:hypothetical protein
MSIVSVIILSAVMPTTAIAGAGELEGTYRVQPFSTNTHTIWFSGGSPARVLIVGDTDTDLDLFVNRIVRIEGAERVGRLEAFDDDELDTCLAAWQPMFGGYYRVTVRNLGSVYNEYTLKTN